MDKIDRELRDEERYKPMNKQIYSKPPVKKCVWCGYDFVPEIMYGGLETHFCGDSCRKEYREHLDLAISKAVKLHKNKGLRFCRNCGKSFTAHHHSQAHCRIKCKKNHEHKNRLKRLKEERCL